MLATNLEARLDEPVYAGSIFKLVAARAALSQGLVTSATRLVCPRRVEVQGRRVDCVHPDLGRPLTLEDALAHSCNHYFVRLAERLDRAGLASALRRLSAGEISMPASGSLPLIVLGLEGPRAGMRAWTHVALAAFTPDPAADPADPGGVARVRLGAVRAVTEGTASALADPTMLTLAKTGTTLGKGAAQEGYAVAWRPEVGEAIVVRAPGVAGRDAARIARLAWDASAELSEPRVRVARVRHGQDESLPPRIDDVPLEAYVARVVAAEGEASMPAMSLQALAVAARSYARALPARHAGEAFDLCDTTHCQVPGVATRWSREATARTSGLVLANQSGILAVPYSASCSGVLSSPRALWGGPAPGAAADVTRSGPDPVEHDVPIWESVVTADALLAALRKAGYRGDVLRGVRVAAHGSVGVPSRIALDGLAPVEVDATTFRHIVGRRLGWDVLKSHAWEITRTGGGYKFNGRGKGHGAGLCLRGASVFAARGGALQTLLATYAPGAVVISARDDVSLRVPSTYTTAAPRLRLATLAALADLRERLAVSAPRAIVIEVHPTVEAYQRASGRAWWTAASTRPLQPVVAAMPSAGRSDGTTAPSEPGASRIPGVVLRYRIDVAPLPGGRAASVDGLEAVLRHELTHVLTDPVLSGQAPAWAVEGIAYVASRSREVGAPAVSPPLACPTDQAITRPGSLEAMRTAYQSAGACVLAALPSGLASWRTLQSR